MPLPHHGGHNYQQLDSLDEENGDGDKTDDGDFVDGDRFIDANFTLTSPPKGDDNDEKDRSGINVSFADGSHSNAALEAVRWQAYLDSRASGYGAVVADASVSFAEYDREEEEVPLEAFDPSLWGSGGRSFWQNDTTVEDTAYWEDAHEYAGQSRAAVLAAGNQRLERQNTRQQQQGQFDNSSRQPRQFSLTQEGIHRSNYRQHLPSRYGNDGRRLPTSSSNTIVDGDDSSDEDIYRFESLSHQRSFSRDQLGRYDGPETAMKRRPPLNGYRNRPPDQPPPWRHDFPGSYGGGYSDSHRDEARTFYSGDGGRDGGDGSDVGDTGGQNHNSQSAKLDPRTQHSETAAIPHLVNALHRPDYYGPPLTPAVNVDAARVLGSNDTFRAQINSGTETYYSNSNTHYNARTSRQSSGTFPLGSEGGDTRSVGSWQTYGTDQEDPLADPEMGLSSIQSQMKWVEKDGKWSLVDKEPKDGSDTKRVGSGERKVEENGEDCHEEEACKELEDAVASNASSKKSRRVSFLWSTKESTKAKWGKPQRASSEKPSRRKTQSENARAGAAASTAAAVAAASSVSAGSQETKSSIEGDSVTADANSASKGFFSLVRARKNDKVVKKEPAKADGDRNGDNKGDDSSVDGDGGKSEDEERRRDRCPISKGLLSNFVSSRFRRMKHPVYWCGMNAGITVACVWFLAWRYTRFLCERRTEFINAGRIFGAELHGRGWDPPPEINHLVSVRKSANGRKFTFLSAHGNYDFMVKSNYHVCASAMPQLRCECEEESGSGCAINPKFGQGGFLIRNQDYRSGDWSDAKGANGGPQPNNPCQNIFNDCVLDGFDCDNYATVQDGCPVLPIGDPIGNRPVSEVKDFDKRDWELLGRCDSRELCNGVTAVQYLVCKTWREALPMALAWVALIEGASAVVCFVIFFVLLRHRETMDGRKHWSPCAPFSVGDVRAMVEVLVPDNADRGHFFSQAREQQLSMGLRDVGRRVPYDGKRRWDGRPANGRGRMRWDSGDVYDGEWKHGMMHGLGRFTFANGSEYVGHFRSGLRHGAGRFTFAHKSFEYDWARHASFHGVPKLVKKGNITPRSAAALAAAAAAAGSHDNEDEEDIGSQGSTWRARSPSRPRTKASTTTNEVPAASQDQLTPPREQLPMSPSGLAQRAFNLVADLTTGDTGATTPRNNNNKRSSKDHNVVGDNAAMSSSARAKMRWKDGANKLKVMGALGKTPTALQPAKGKKRYKVKRGPDMFGSKAHANTTNLEDGDDNKDVEEVDAEVDEDEEAAADTSRNAKKNGAKTGIEGRWVWPNGDCFEGTWHKSLKRPADQPSARMNWVGGDVYEGPWRYGHPVLGVVTWRARYVGDFKHGQEDGLGRYTWRDRGTGRDGNEWDGEWRRGAITFRGVYTRSRDGAMWFENQWVTGCQKHPHRIGMVVTPEDGVEHVGEYCWDGGMVESVDENDLFFAHRVGEYGKKCGVVLLIGFAIWLSWWLTVLLLSFSEEVYTSPNSDPYFSNKTHLSFTSLDPATVVADDDRALPIALQKF